MMTQVHITLRASNASRENTHSRGSFIPAKANHAKKASRFTAACCRRQKKTAKVTCIITAKSERGACVFNVYACEYIAVNCVNGCGYGESRVGAVRKWQSRLGGFEKFPRFCVFPPRR